MLVDLNRDVGHISQENLRIQRMCTYAHKTKTHPNSRIDLARFLYKKRVVRRMPIHW